MCVCVYLSPAWPRPRKRQGSVEDVELLSDFVNEGKVGCVSGGREEVGGEVSMSVVPERPAQVATGGPTSLGLKRKQRKMHRKKVPSLICEATA